MTEGSSQDTTPLHKAVQSMSTQYPSAVKGTIGCVNLGRCESCDVGLTNWKFKGSYEPLSLFLATGCNSISSTGV